VTTALLLAAGTGSRLSPLTDMLPKCLVQLNGISILERLIDSLKSYGFKRLVIVVGHHDECIRDFLGTRAGGMEITYIVNPVYDTTNNIYSLWLARHTIDEPFMLLESDIVFKVPVLEEMLWPDRIAVAKLQPWMNGTTVTIDQNQEINAFWASGSEYDSLGGRQYKTVNIYSLSTQSWRLVKERLEQYISNNKVNGYYETVFSELVEEGSINFTSVLFSTDQWYEIDTLDDLYEAEQLFPKQALARLVPQIPHIPNIPHIPLIPMTQTRQVLSQSKVNPKIKPHGLMS
jgi:NDP-sugar pyrophosphorylase family protein